jgi:GntR family transcriptional regulator/MocR family aminotransferase
MRQIYKARRQLLCDLLKRDFADWLEPIPSLYGMHVAAWARDGVNLDAAVKDLSGRAIKIHTLERYYAGDSRRPGLVFGYGAVGLPEIERARATLRKSLGTCASTR